MATFSAVTRQHILAAIAEYDDRGAQNFLGVYGFTRTVRESLEHEGHEYDARAVLGVAHKFATGRTATADELAGSTVDAVTILRKRGFDATGPVTAPPAPAPRARRAAPSTPRAPRTTAARRTSEPERPAPVCPTCFMTLPATGVCDTCG
ncbi:hypothetical protein [Cellulosimicrobium arenosum]|uniref:ScoMcrA-like N-terminal head domain-containing protein n=1 Tax=Cellulosimicrobium arenosum TaxID=2708133 RepID=A0A927G683_9MICO|nr:hypothetical protein [Cellulosimicrobium arenosum]MBD8077776.1 hypothetical protein [Cellulosimicrobium arenosum]